MYYSRVIDIWTIIAGVKLALDVSESKPEKRQETAVKGVLMLGVPGSGIIAAGQLLYGLFGLDGRYKGEVIVKEDQYVPPESVNFAKGEMERLKAALNKYDFPRLAEREFARLEPRKFPKMESPEFPKMGKKKFPKI